SAFPLSVLGGVLNQSERAQISNTPAVNNLSTERHLVIALQVAVTIRVTVSDVLQADGLLNAPADGREVAHDSREIVVLLGNVLRGHSARDSNRMPVQLGHARETNVRVNPDALLGAGGAERLQETGIGGDTRGDLPILQEGRVGGLQNLPRLERRVQLDRVGRIHERLALHSRRASASQRVDAVNDTEVQRTSQRRLDRVQNLLKNTELVILIRPLKLVSNANGLLELERLESLNRRGKVRTGLVLALTNILGLARVKNNSLALPELHRDLTRQLRNNGRLLDLLQPRSEILVRDRQITGIK